MNKTKLNKVVTDLKSFNWKAVIDYGNSLGPKFDDAQWRFLKGLIMEKAAEVHSGDTTFKYVDERTVVSLVFLWLCFVLLCMGLVTFEQLARLKNGGSEITTTTVSSIDQTTVVNDKGQNQEGAGQADSKGSS